MTVRDSAQAFGLGGVAVTLREAHGLTGHDGRGQGVEVVAVGPT
jgi:hypothetical protein